MRINWLVKLRHLLQTTAFCLAIAGLKLAYQPDTPYEHPLVYTLCIGIMSWLLIDFGRHLFVSAHESGWPSGVWGALLPVGGIVLGYVVGTLLADWWFGSSTWAQASGQQLLVYALTSAVSGIVVTYYFYASRKGDYLEQKIGEVTHLATEARLKVLETQLEPHMLFNTLANLRVLIGTDPQRAQAMLDRMVAYLRATLGASRTSSHSLQQEFDRLQDYLELMAVRMGPRMHYTLDLPPDLAHCSIPTLLLQPLVENSIKHGLEPKVEGGTITVRALRYEHQQLMLEVSDTGVGFDSTATAAEGYGLAHVRERLSATYADQGRVVQTSTPGHGTTTFLYLPIVEVPDSQPHHVT